MKILQNTETSKRGSILLYVLFLSSFLILFFVSFQGELERMFEWAKSSEASVEEISSIQDTLVLLKNAPSGTKTVDSNEHLSFQSLVQNGNVFSGTFLGNNDSEEYWLTSTGGAISLSLALHSGGPILYHIATFNSGSEVSATLLSSGVVTTSATIPLSPLLDTHILVLESLGGNTEYTLDGKTTTLSPSMTSYRLGRDIKGYTKDEWLYDVQHFAKKSRTHFEYGKMGMYLRE